MKRIFYIVLLVIITIISHAQNYEHLIMYGQSLSTGHQSWPPLSVENVSGNHMIGNQVWSNFGNSATNQLKALIANVAATTASLSKTRASMIYGESPIVAAANHIQLKTNHQFQLIASSCGTGGKTIEELSKEHYNPVCYGHFSNAIQYASKLSNHIHCPAIFWMQGEYNYTVPAGNSGLTSGSRPTADKNTYKSLMLTLKNNMQADIKAKYQQSDDPLFITYQAGVQYTRGVHPTIGMAQLEASNENDDIVCAGPVYPMTDRGGHLDSNGYRWFGEILGKVYYRTKILGQDFKPLQPLQISRTANPKEVKIKFLVPQLPLVIDESLVEKVTGAGFELYAGGAKKIISNIRIEEDCVILTGITNLTGDIEIIYAGTNNAGHGNLRDSDDYPAYYTYIDLDKKNSNGSYFFARDASETTLRPNYEPKDGHGIIYNKPYPLYNFCVAFYYKLPAGEEFMQVPGLEDYTAVETVNINNQKRPYIQEDNLILPPANIAYKHVNIIDLAGKTVFSKDISRLLHEQQQMITLPALANGVYIVNIQYLDKSTQAFTVYYI